MTKTVWLVLLACLICFAIYRASDPSYDKTVNDDYDLLLGDGSHGDMVNGKLERPILDYTEHTCSQRR